MLYHLMLLRMVSTIVLSLILRLLVALWRHPIVVATILIMLLIRMAWVTHLMTVVIRLHWIGRMLVCHIHHHFVLLPVNWWLWHVLWQRLLWLGKTLRCQTSLLIHSALALLSLFLFFFTLYDLGNFGCILLLPLCLAERQNSLRYRSMLLAV